MQIWVSLLETAAALANAASEAKPDPTARKVASILYGVLGAVKADNLGLDEMTDAMAEITTKNMPLLLAKLAALDVEIAATKARMAAVEAEISALQSPTAVELADEFLTEITKGEG